MNSPRATLHPWPDATLALLGLAWLASDTVFDGLCRLARFSKLVTTAADVTVREAGELVHMDFNRSALSFSP